MGKILFPEDFYLEEMTINHLPENVPLSYTYTSLIRYNIFNLFIVSDVVKCPNNTTNQIFLDI